MNSSGSGALNMTGAYSGGVNFNRRGSEATEVNTQDDDDESSTSSESAIGSVNFAASLGTGTGTGGGSYNISSSLKPQVCILNKQNHSPF
jgi:hypothetical protein